MIAGGFGFSRLSFTGLRIGDLETARAGFDTLKGAVFETIVNEAETVQVYSIASAPAGYVTQRPVAHLNLYNKSILDSQGIEPVRFVLGGRKVRNPASAPTDLGWDSAVLAPYRNFGVDGDADGIPISNGNYDPALGVMVYQTGQVSIGWNATVFADFLNPAGGHAANAAMLSVATLANTKNTPASNTIPYVASFRDRDKSMNILFLSPSQTKKMTLNDANGYIEFDTCLLYTSPSPRDS